MSWKPILIFVDETASFVHGFEAGRIWGSLHEDPHEQSFTVHGVNAELMIRMSEATKRGLIWEEIDDPIWCKVTFGPKPQDQ